MKILLAISVLLSVCAIALTGHEVSSGAWILVLLMTGFWFGVLFLCCWRSRQRIFAPFVGLIFLVLCGACVVCGKFLEEDAIKNTQLVINAIKRYEKREGRFPNAILELTAADLASQIDRTFLAPGGRFWVFRNVDGSDACVVREAFPFGKRIRCSTWDTERTVFD